MKWFRDSFGLMAMGIKAGIQLSYGVYRLSRLTQPIIAIFGGKGAHETGKYAKWAERVGQICVEHNMSVITGGGPGIMEAANCGAHKVGHNQKQWTLGIGVKGVDTSFTNTCAPLIMVDHFFTRKWLLTQYAAGFILFPGGLGTMDELFEVLNLSKLGKMKRVPIILVGTSYWKDLISWYQHAFDYGLIPIAPQNEFVVTDEPEHAVQVIVASRTIVTNKT